MSSAAEIRANRQQTPKTIPVTLSDGSVIDCRRPPLLTLATRGWVEWPALQRVQALAIDQAIPDGLVIDNRPVPTVSDKAQGFGALLDEWVCEAAISPRVVLTEAESTAEILWLEDLTIEDRLAIFNATFPRTPSTVAEFRGDEPPGAPDRPGGEAVRDAALDAPGGA